jgi:hypothetical protein
MSHLRMFSLLIVCTAMASCTLLLDTEGLIAECVVQADCGDGFICDENACLPVSDGQ